MDPMARRSMNLNVLRRHDPDIVEIIDSSSHAVLYQFSPTENAWTKKNVEGTMFVYKRCKRPVYGFVVMNRLGIDNFMAHLTPEMELEFQGEYIIYHTSIDDIVGIWVYEPNDRERIGKRMMECCRMSDISVPPPQIVDSQQVLLPLRPSNSQDEAPAQQQQQGARNPIRRQTPPQTRYGKQIDLLTLFQQADLQKANGIVVTPPPPPQRMDVLAELMANMKPPPVTSPAAAPNVQPLDGKQLLELLKQPPNTSHQQPPLMATAAFTSTQTPPPQRPLSHPGDVPLYLRSTASSPFPLGAHQLSLPAQTNIGGSMLLPPNLLSTIPMTESGLTRKEALNASIGTLPFFLENTRDASANAGQAGRGGAPAALSKDEFVRQYVTLVQVVSSAMRQAIFSCSRYGRTNESNSKEILGFSRTRAE